LDFVDGVRRDSNVRARIEKVRKEAAGFVNGSAADFLLNFRVTKLFYAIFIIYLRIDFYWHGIMLGCMFAHR